MKIIITLILACTIMFASIGKISAMKGDITINGDKPSYKTEIELKDFIKTGKNAKIQIKFNDGTIFTVGKNSTLDIEKFLYDESKPKINEAKFNVLKGAFSSITGRIGKLNKEKFKLRTKSASIGIRGTIVKANQKIIQCTEGAITVTTNNGKTVNVEAGQQTNVSSGTPSTPIEIDNSTENEVIEDKEIAEEVVLEIDKKIEKPIYKEISTNWGYWDSGKENYEGQTNYESHYYVQGTKTLTLYLDNLRNDTTTTTATYKGSVIGEVTGNDTILENSNNQVNLNFNLGGGKNSFDGYINFDTESGQQWKSNITGDTSGNGFTSQSVSGIGNDRAITSGNVDGSFYKSEAQEAAGTFELNAGESTAIGVFKANKQ